MKNIFYRLVILSLALLFLGCEQIVDFLEDGLITKVQLTNQSSRYDISYTYQKQYRGRWEWETISEDDIYPNSTSTLQNPGSNFDGRIRIILNRAKTINNPSFPLSNNATFQCGPNKTAEFIIYDNNGNLSFNVYETTNP